MRKLYRSTRDRKLFGVCGGLADYLGMDATLLRIALIAVTVFSAGSVVIVYIIAGLVIPREPSFGGGYGGNPFDQGWKGHDHQPNYGYGNQSWNPNGNNAGQGPVPGGSPGYAGTHTTAPRPGPSVATPPVTGRAPQGLDAMMEDIEKKSLQREIEELKARISKFEKQSKGE
ncbi:PspC domain-containing protein [Cohnella endophytica]|uniref:PspC domain-containing protein n=1 Tax=Cohnella endophytica TaxID=2419778 RepID=A0A494Y263_9BACL|nr:PspC domain-containing protein [Cohnella endophytica]RKP56080.1 PspC domain-containing protein [Cohnella endophytica]